MNVALMSMKLALLHEIVTHAAKRLVVEREAQIHKYIHLMHGSWSVTSFLQVPFLANASVVLDGIVHSPCQILQSMVTKLDYISRPLVQSSWHCSNNVAEIWPGPWLKSIHMPQSSPFLVGGGWSLELSCLGSSPHALNARSLSLSPAVTWAVWQCCITSRTPLWRADITLPCPVGLLELTPFWFEELNLLVPVGSPRPLPRHFSQGTLQTSNFIFDLL